MDSRAAGAAHAGGRARRAAGLPLTERILSWLPGPAWIWVAVWTLLVAIRPVVVGQLVHTMGQLEGTSGFVRDRLPGHVVYAYMVAVSFWAVRKFTADAGTLEPTLERLAPRTGEAGRFFAAVSSAAGPIALTAVLSAVLFIDQLTAWGPAAALVILPYIVLVNFPLMTLFWVYILMLLGLDRLGRHPMHLRTFPQDPSLGLGPVGVAAFDAFLVFCALTVPFLLVSLRERLDLGIGLAFFVVGVAAFFLSMWRMHRQMVDAKRGRVATVRALYAEAFEPVRTAPGLGVLHDRAPLLSAAEALERRALAIQEWPFDDRTMARIVGISTGVVTAVIVRLVLRAMGL